MKNQKITRKKSVRKKTRKQENKTFLNSFTFNRILILLIIILFVTTLVNIFQIFDKPLEVRELDVKFMIGNTTGFDLDTSLLTFGRISPYNSANRKVNLHNGYDFPIEVKILITKNINKFISTKPIVIIPAGQNSSISFILIPLENASFGNYSGKVMFEMRRYRE